ncbi:PREDICTED: interleukin-1 receptor-like 1 [Nanorana parkeri]|uniref:interleukin-1 receptor-like 1 n=1 Tax=Nanorana parkeri TaxID=125878 RepID=UPI0008540E46|nr:PREDICTED: interleukin-1 receptor-like 1 [Nanorana parkeri]
MEEAGLKTATEEARAETAMEEAGGVAEARAGFTVLGQHDTMLYISDISKSDSGTYTCSFTYMYNGKPYNATRNIPVRVSEPNRMDPIVFSVVVLGALSCLLLLLYTRYKIDLVLLCRDIFKKYHYRNDGKEYDAYVIYPSTCYENSTDNSADYFVNTILPKVLENKCGFRLFVPGRNAVPGEVNIRDIYKLVSNYYFIDVSSSSAINIEKSRRLIIVLNAETRSMDSLYDQQIGLYSALIYSSLKVIIITLGKMNENTEMQDSLMYIMNQKGSIQWDDKSNDTLSPNSQFWKRVRYQMPVSMINKLDSTVP